MVSAGSMVGPWAARASLDADLLHRSRSFDPQGELEQHGRRLQHRAAELPARPGRVRSDVAQRLQLDCWRRHWLESGHQPELRLRIDVSEHSPGTAERVPRHCSQPWRRGRGGLRARPVEWQQRGFRGPSPHHPLLLVAPRSVETDSPGARAPGEKKLFHLPPPPMNENKDCALPAMGRRVGHELRSLVNMSLRGKRRFTSAKNPDEAFLFSPRGNKWLVLSVSFLSGPI